MSKFTPPETVEEIINLAVKLVSLKEIPSKQRSDTDNNLITEISRFFADNATNAFESLVDSELVFLRWGEDDPIESAATKWDRLLTKEELQPKVVSAHLIDSQGNDVFVHNTEAYASVLGGLEEISPIVNAYNSILKRLHSVVAAMCPAENQWKTEALLDIMLDPKLFLSYQRLKMTQEKLELRSKSLERCILTISRMLGQDTVSKEVARPTRNRPNTEAPWKKSKTENSPMPSKPEPMMGKKYRG